MRGRDARGRGALKRLSLRLCAPAASGHLSSIGGRSAHESVAASVPLFSIGCQTTIIGDSLSGCVSAVETTRGNGFRSIAKNMSTTHLTSATALVMAAALISPWAFAQTPPVEAFAALPATQSPALSPDGTRLAFITHSGADTIILVANLEDMSVTNAIGMSDLDQKPQTIFWPNQEAVVITAGGSGGLIAGAAQSGFGIPFGVDLTVDGKITRLAQNRSGGFSVPFTQLVGFQRNTDKVLYPQSDLDRNRVLYAINPKNDRQTIVDRAPAATNGWVVNESGEPQLRSEYNARSQRLTLFAKRGRNWEVLVSETVEIPELSAHGLNDEGDVIIRTRPEGTDRYGLYTLSVETGDIGEPILFHDQFDVGEVRLDPFTNRVIGAEIADLSPIWFDDEFAEHQALLNDAFPGESPVMVSWSEDRTRFLVTTNAGDRVPGVYFYDATVPSVDQVGSAYTALQGVRLAARRPYNYTARDGTTIPGYLTRPLDADGPTAAVVLPHGGPAARDFGGFDWMAQFLASRGYTVLQPNFRGSSGYGKAWEEAGHGEWGIGVMQHDLSDGVAALVDEGQADPDRVCIVGEAYGGYAALAGAVFTPELYACAAAIAPMVDLVTMLGNELGGRNEFSLGGRQWRLRLGGGDEERLNDRLRTASPAEYAERVQAPILLIHGDQYTFVSLGQSRKMARALESEGKSVELIELETEKDELSFAETRLTTLQALDRFLAEHLQ